MQNITIGRYKPVGPSLLRPFEDGRIVHDVADYFAGWIEGIRDDGTSWIMWLDESGSPQSFWAQREPDGGVIGEAIDLAP